MVVVEMIARSKGSCYSLGVSAAEIIAELPKLTEADRAAISQKLRELEDADTMQFMDEAATQAFQDMDELEATH